MLPTKFGVNWLLCLGVETKKIIFQDGCHVGLLVQEKRKIDFQDAGHGGHLGFSIGMILLIFYLQVTLLLSTKYRVNWPRGVGRVGF